MKFSVISSSLLLLAGAASALSGARKPVKQLRKELDAKRRTLAKRDQDPAALYPVHNISVPIDFFHNETRYEPHTNGTFPLHYWFDASNYKRGGPVVVLLGGETDGSDRLPYLQKGIVAQLTKATGGLGVILEHRYYGPSQPFKDLSTAHLRFLSTEQALAEIDYFARNAKFPGIDADLTAPQTPWIAYGGSYAGAQAAFLRVQYPETFWGTISSSGVTKSIYDYWEYFEPIRQFAYPDCVRATQLMVDVVDKILLSKNNTGKIPELKGAYGLGGVTDNRNFANVLTNGIYGWQSTNWDPDVNSPSFFYYCQNMTATLNYPDKESKRDTVKDLIAAAGYGEDKDLENIVLNSIGYFNRTQVASCDEQDQNKCFTVNNATFYAQDDISTYSYRSWNYQVCTEWGFIQTGSTPPTIMPLISRSLDLEFLTEFCKLSFNITAPPKVENVNKYGGFDIEYDRLAIIGGQADPWRPATPLADAARKRNSTLQKPVHLLADAVHHWDENGIFPNQTPPLLPPLNIVRAQQFEKDFVLEWLKEWNDKTYGEL